MVIGIKYIRALFRSAPAAFGGGSCVAIAHRYRVRFGSRAELSQTLLI
jgi:hypothetical protein